MKRGYRRTGVCAALLGILFLSAVSPAMSANLIANPQISLDERWDSNIQNTSTDEISDFVARATPRLTLTLETLRTQLNLMGGIEFERYAKHTELNERATTFYNLSTSRPMQFSPRFSLLPSVRFVESNDPVRRNTLTQSPTPGLPPSETVVTARTKSREVAGSLHLGYLLTANVDLSVGGGGSKRTFFDNNAGGIDSDTVSGNASFAYRLTPRFSTGIYVNTSRNTFADNTVSRSYGVGLSGTYLVSEHYTLGARVGADLLKESTTAGEDTVRSPSGELSLNYDWKGFKAMILGTYGLAGGGSFGVTTHRGTIQLSLTDQFAQNWWWDLSGSYQINRSLDTPRTEDISTWYGNAGLRYQAAEWASFRLAGNILRQRARNSIEGSDLDRGSVVLGLDLSKAYKLF